MQDAGYWILFQQIFGYGTSRSQKIIDEVGHPAALFDASYSQIAAMGLLTGTELRRLRQATPTMANKILESCRELGCQILTLSDESYPERLRAIYAPPAVLYIRGSLDGLDETLAIAIVGTRNRTSYGRQAAGDIAYNLARQGVVIVSGLALGIDADSHAAALQAGGRTVAVMGSGLQTIYPAVNKELHRLILEGGGAIVTEFPPEETPKAFHFPIRNRIISGLCQGTVVVEGTRHSGSLITAGHALAQGRDVFALPGSIYSTYSQATNWLIAQGATPVTHWKDILEAYGCILQEEPCNLSPNREDAKAAQEGIDNKAVTVYNRQQRTRAKIDHFPQSHQQQLLPPQLTDTQRAVYNALEAEPVSVDILTTRCGLPVAEVLSTLTQLELFGCIRVYPGRRFGL